MRRPILLLLLLLTTCGAGRMGASHASHARAGAADPNPMWLAEVRARIRDGSYRFSEDGGHFRAEVPERGLTARFDEGGAHILSASDPDGTPIHLRATRLGRAGSSSAILATVPSLGDCQDGKVDPAGGCVPRLEFASAGLTEWWEAGTAGLEQGWVLEERPDGDGPVEIALAVGNADVTVEAAGLNLRGDDGNTLVVSRLRAWDARGDDVPARFERDDDGFRVVVDDVGAVYPLEVDPVYTSADWVVEGGVEGYGDEFGVVIAGAGDTNGDGYDDVLVGSDSGTWLFEGSAEGVARIAAASYSAGWFVAPAGDVDGDGDDDVLLETHGQQLAAAGDVNGDGYADVVSGYFADADPPHGWWHHFGLLYLGSATGLASSPIELGEVGAVCVYGEGEMEGAAAAAGDVNGDGYDDVIFADACLNSMVPYSYAFVFHGSPAGVDGTGFTVTSYWDVLSVAAIASAGDVNGDGFDDVLVGTPLSVFSTFTGQVEVHLGSAAGVSETAITTFVGESSTSPIGADVDGAGDVNADGYDDIVIGPNLYAGSSTGVDTTPLATLLGSGVGAGDTNGDGYSDVLASDPTYNSATPDGGYGSAWLYLGSPTAAMENYTQLVGRGEHLGISIANAGDVNGDGYDDLIVGADGYLGSTGEALIYQGSAAGFASTASSVLIGSSAWEYFGSSVAAAGDTDADGYDDVIIGAWGAGDYGSAYTFAGSPGGVQTTPQSTISGDSATPDLGSRVAGIGDVNHDGYADVAVATSSGASFVGIYAGSSTGTLSTPTTRLNIPYAPSSLAAAGDVNGDLFDDLVVGCEENTFSAGRAYLYEGSVFGTMSTPSVTLTGAHTDDHFGHSVGSAGDVNGDGYGDVVVGAYGHGDNLGRVYVYEGGPAGLSTTPPLDGTTGADHLGASVASAGDVNGDGYDDVRVSATGYGDIGGLYVYSGSTGGITSTILSRRTRLGSLGDGNATGDFNGDGLLDVVVGDSTDAAGAGTVSAYYGCVDEDGDGYCEDEDCDEGDPSVPFVVYPDTDGDGFGNAEAGSSVCAPVADWVSDGSDCNDDSSVAYPGSPEVCDHLDNDCDGGVDNDPLDETTWYSDADRDGYTDANDAVVACFAPDYYSGQSADADCDDGNWGVHPDATEPCDGIDNDCDGQTDEEPPTWYADADGDGFTDPEVWVIGCDGREGYMLQSWPTDCDDTRADIRPNASEVCDGIDNDCDGVVDSDAIDRAQWFADQDQDGYAGAIQTISCDPAPADAATSTGGDCDDHDPDIYPGAGDPPGDGIDQNCNGRDTPGKTCGCESSSGPSGLALMLLGAMLARRSSNPSECRQRPRPHGQSVVRY